MQDNISVQRTDGRSLCFVRDYLINLRVNRAKELLLTGSFSVNQVAAEVGFADQSHLHRYFKRIFGITLKAVLRG